MLQSTPTKVVITFIYLISLNSLLPACLSITGVNALSSHSPQDLHAFPKFEVVLSDQSILNDTAEQLLRERRTPESSARPGHGDNLDEGSEDVIHLLRTPAGQAFLCSVPGTDADLTSSTSEAAQREQRDGIMRQMENESGLEKGLELLEPMRMGCLYQKQNWFTYSFCYGNEIRQFHEVRVPGSVGPTEDPNADSYTLGRAPEPASTVPPKYGSGSGSLSKKEARIPATLGGGNEMGLGWNDGGRYLSQIWEDGTICDKTGMPRTVEVQFHCNTQTIDRIALIRETAICRYVMIIHTPRLCSEPVFLEGREISSQGPLNKIHCRPVVKKHRGLVDAPLSQEVYKGEPEAEYDDGVGHKREDDQSADYMQEQERSSARAKDDVEQSEGDLLIEDRQKEDPLEAVELVVVYDPATGEIIQSDFLQSADASHGANPDIPGEESVGMPADGPHTASIQMSTDPATVLRRTIVGALREYAARQGDADPVDGPIVVNGVAFQGLQDLIGFVSRASENEQRGEGEVATTAEMDSATASDANEKRRQTLRQYLKQFDQLKLTGVAPVDASEGAVLGSTEYSELAKRFSQRYEDEEKEGDEGGDQSVHDRIVETAGDGIRPRIRDEL